MSLDIISKDILSIADSEIEILEKEVMQSLSFLEEESKGNIEKFKEDFNTKYDSEVRTLRQNILGNYQKEAKKVVLETKSNLMRETYDSVLLSLIEMNEKDKEKFFKKLFDSVSKSVEVSIVKCSKDLTKIIKNIVSKGVNVVEDNKVSGVIVESKDSKVIVDLTYEAIVRDYFTNNEGEVMSLLFNWKWED